MRLLSPRKWHRWLGYTLGWLMLVWFVSGAVMMYAHPSKRFMSPEGRLGGAPVLQPGQIRLSLQQAWVVAGSPQRLAQAQLGQVGGRPAYFFLIPGAGRRVIWADDGRQLLEVSPKQAEASARQFLPAEVPLRHQGLVTSDQWTVTIPPQFGLGPYHKFAAQDPSASEIYVSAKTGEVCQVTTRGARFWAWTGAIPHVLLFTVIRQHMDLWRWSLMVLAALGCVLCLTGLWLGVKFFRLKGYGKGKHHRYSAYTGMRKWHHYLGLIFGLPALAWCLSGLLFLNPFNWSTPPRPAPQMVMAWSGGPLRVGQCALAPGQAVTALLDSGFQVRMLDLLNFQGSPYYLALDGHGGSRLVPAGQDRASVLSALPREQVATAAGRLLPGHQIQSAAWQNEGGVYLPKWRRPIYKVAYQDPDSTWLFIDPARAAIISRQDTSTRLNRWLAHFLHALDLPWLLEHRMVRDAILLLFISGGFAMCLTGLWSWLARKRHS